MSFKTLDQAIEQGEKVRDGKGCVVISYLHQEGFYIVSKTDLWQIKKPYKIEYDFFKHVRGKVVGRPTLTKEQHAARVEAVSGKKTGDASKSRAREETLMKRLGEAETDDQVEEVMNNWIIKNKEIDSRKRPAALPESLKAPVGDSKFTLVRNDRANARGRTYVNTQKDRPKGSMSSKATRNYLTKSLSSSEMVGMPISGKSRTVLKKEAEENKVQRCRDVVARKVTKNIIKQRTNKTKDESKAERNRRRKAAKKARG